MQFKPNGNRFLWDFWFLDDSSPEKLELFYLTAPFDEEPETRHMNANIARASRDKNGQWIDHGIVFSPSPNDNAWDNQATWTGSALKLKKPLFAYSYLMPYTGINKKEKAAMQRISFALSHDGLNWVRDERMPVLEANPQYHKMHNANWHNETAFRDPYIMELADGCYVIYVTTERKDAPQSHCGSISAYVSKDFIHWELQEEPVTTILPFAQMEVPTPFYWQGQYYMIFSCVKKLVASNDMGIPQFSGAFYLVSDNPLKGFAYGGLLIGHDQDMPLYYTPKIVNNNGQLEMYAWRGYDKNNQFGGYLDGPFKVKL